MHGQTEATDILAKDLPSARMGCGILIDILPSCARRNVTLHFLLALPFEERLLD